MLVKYQKSKNKKKYKYYSLLEEESHLRLFSPQSVILIPIDVCKTNSSQKVYTNLILTI